ncbi:MAG: ABC transporter permease [Motilibacteraceae bacterium]
MSTSSSASLSFAATARLVARRELRSRLRDRSFLVSTGITLLIVVAVAVVPAALGLGRTKFSVAFTPAAAPLAAPSEALAHQLDVSLRVEDAPANPEQAVRDGDLDAFVTADRIVVHKELDPQLGTILQTAARQAATQRQLAADGLSAAQMAALAQLPTPAVDALQPKDPKADTRRGIATVGAFLLYGQLLGYGFWVALGVVEEKSSRVVEVLLATVRPRALLTGKVLGVGALGLVQLLAVAVVGLVAGSASGAIDLTADAVYPVALVLAWFVLGYAFYACAFAAAAARVSRQEDLNSVTTPMTMLVLVSFLATFYVSSSPDSPAARVLAVVPPFSALVNPVRIAGGDASWWELPLAVLLMLGAVVGLVVVGARLYEGAVLRMGGTVSLRDAWRGRREAGVLAD